MEYYSLEELLKPNEALAQLEKLIEEAGQPGEYFAKGLSIVPIPRIEVEGVGVLSFPIPEFQAKQLLDVAERSPFGKGMETVIDSSVRDCWHFDPSEIKITGQAWNETLEQILKQASIDLGCPPSGLRAELYKLLVYDTGGFFKPHRDTEKAEGMVATLVISLPVGGTGGELVIRHKSQETVISMATDNPSELYWAAFYADCEHEVQPVTSGHRICLVYNLIVKSGEEIFEPPTEFTTRQRIVATELLNVSSSLPNGNKLVWVFEHEYTEAGLSLQTLKNVDASVGKLLVEVSKNTDYIICTALLDISATYDSYGYGGDYYADGEHIETDAYLSRLRFPDGTVSPDLEIPLLPGELMPSGCIDPKEPDDEEFEGYYGNAEPTIDRIYNRAALVLWPKNTTLEVVGEGGVSVLLFMFFSERQYILDQKNDPALIGKLADNTLMSLVNAPENELEDLFRENVVSSLQCLVEEASDEPLLEYYKNLVFKYYQMDYNPILLTLLKRLPTVETLPNIHDYISSCTTKDYPALVVLVGEIYQYLSYNIVGSVKNGVDLEKLLKEMVSALTQKVSSVEIKKEWEYSTENLTIELDTFVKLMDLAAKLSLFEQINILASGIIKRKDLVSPARELPKLLSMLLNLDNTRGLFSSALRNMGEQVAGYLTARSATPPKPPQDWRLPKANNSTDLHQSKILREFCLCPTSQVQHFRANERIRKKLESIITLDGLDIDCHTIRQGSPYTLVCTKNRASFQRRLKEYDEDVLIMEQMVSLASKVKISNQTVSALKKAILLSQQGSS